MLNKKCFILFTVVFATIALLGIYQVQAQSPVMCQEVVVFGNGSILLKFDPATTDCKFLGAWQCTTPGDLSTCTVPLNVYEAYCCDGDPSAGATCSKCNFGSADTGCYFGNWSFYVNGGTIQLPAGFP